MHIHDTHAHTHTRTEGYVHELTKCVRKIAELAKGHVHALTKCVRKIAELQPRDTCMH